MKVEKKQRFHLEPWTGLLNDPNGLVYFQGKYHVFFQWNRFKKNHSYKEWGHFSSENLTGWKFDGSAIMPDQAYDQNGVYSGSAYVRGNQLCLFYTGNDRSSGKRKSSQCLAVTGNGKTFIKKGIILSTPNEYTEHFRDPKVWKSELGYYMAVGAQRKNGKGAIALCTSQDGEVWNYKNALAVSETYEMIECPDLFRLGSKYILIYCLQHRDNEKDTPVSGYAAYKVVSFDEEKGVLEDTNLDQNRNVMEYGFDFYAPQTFIAPDGRRILFAWMSRMTDCEEAVFANDETSIHCMTMARELNMKGDMLCQRPIRELEECLIESGSVKRQGQKILLSHPTRTYCLKLWNLSQENSIIIEFQGKEAIVKYDGTKKTFSLQRLCWDCEGMEERACQLDELEELEIWSDNSSIEIFVNQGEKVFSSRLNPVFAEGTVRVSGVSDKATLKMYDIVLNEEDHNE